MHGQLRERRPGRGRRPHGPGGNARHVDREVPTSLGSSSARPPPARSCDFLAVAASTTSRSPTRTPSSSHASTAGQGGSRRAAVRRVRRRSARTPARPLYAEALEAAGSTPLRRLRRPTPATTWRSTTSCRMFGLQRRLRAAPSATWRPSRPPARCPAGGFAAGIESVGLPDATARYFHEHVEADAVHEQMAVRDVCGGLLESESALLPDVLFGVAGCLFLDVLEGDHLLSDWRHEAPELHRRNEASRPT